MQAKFQLEKVLLKSILYLILSVCFPENFLDFQYSPFVEHMWPSRRCNYLPSLKESNYDKGIYT